MANASGAHIFTQVEVDPIAISEGGGYTVQCKHLSGDQSEETSLLARRLVVVSAGALGSTGIMLRSQVNGLGLPGTVGTRFSGNGDFIAFGYNSKQRTDALGWGA